MATPDPYAAEREKGEIIREFVPLKLFLRVRDRSRCGTIPGHPESNQWRSPSEWNSEVA